MGLGFEKNVTSDKIALYVVMFGPKNRSFCGTLLVNKRVNHWFHYYLSELIINKIS